MEKTIVIDNTEVTFRATARTPRLYRYFFNRDMIIDMNKLSTSYKKYAELAKSGTEDEAAEARLSVVDLEIFENVAFIMARQADPEMEYKTPDEWLDNFNVFSIYQVMPTILELWALNNKTTSTAKKK